MSNPTDPSRPAAHSVDSAPEWTTTQLLSALPPTCLIAVLSFVVYWPSLRDATLIDDGRYLFANPIVAASDGLYRFWFTTEAVDYYPVSNTTFWIEWRLWESNAIGYRVTNLVIHIATSLLVWLVLRKLAIPGAFLAALLFAVHPVNVEAVAWISQRKDLMALFLALLSILWFLRDLQHYSSASGPRAKTWYWLSLLAFALAMLSKGSVATTPFVILLIIWWLHGCVTVRDVQSVLPFIFVAVLLGLVNAWYQMHGDPVPHAPFATRLAGAGGVVWFYLAKALLPILQVLHYPQWRIDTGDLRWWLPLLAAIGLTAVLVWQCRVRTSNAARTFLFAWGFFCISLGPVMGIAEAGGMLISLVADHYQHFALVGVVASIAAAWHYFYRRTAGIAHQAVGAFAVALTAVLALFTWQESRLFGNPIELYRATLAVNHDALAGAYLHANLGLMLANDGLYDEAAEHTKIALKLMPENAIFHVELGDDYFLTDRFELAIPEYEQALQANPLQPRVHYDLGTALQKTGNLQEAIAHYQQAIDLQPTFAAAHFNMATAYVDLQRVDDAIAQFQEGLQYLPNSPRGHFCLANALRTAGRTAEAIAEYREALRLRPDFPDAQANLDAVLSGDSPPSK